MLNIKPVDISDAMKKLGTNYRLSRHDYHFTYFNGNVEVCGLGALACTHPVGIDIDEDDNSERLQDKIKEWADGLYGVPYANGFARGFDGALINYMSERWTNNSQWLAGFWDGWVCGLALLSDDERL